MIWAGESLRQPWGRWRRWLMLLTAVTSAWLPSCRPVEPPPSRCIVIEQAWDLEPGDVLVGHTVAASLGDISIELRHRTVKAPFAGEVEPAATSSCLYFSTPEIPAYLFRFCGLHRPRFGPVTFGSVIGVGQFVHFATLRRQPDGTWTLVEPSSHVLERALQP